MPAAPESEEGLNVLTVTNQWKIVVKGTDDRYHEVFIDPQSDYGHAKALAQAYATLDPDRPQFVPDARVIREGAVVGLLDALIAVLRRPGPRSTAAAELALRAATDPRFDTDLKESDQITMETVRATGLAGGQAFRDGISKTECPEIYNPGSVLEIAWIKGWEAESMALRPPPT